MLKMKTSDPSPPPSPQQQDERPIIVQPTEPRSEPPPGSTEQAVSEYIARIDDLSRQVADSGQARPAMRGNPADAMQLAMNANRRANQPPGASGPLPSNAPAGGTSADPNRPVAGTNATGSMEQVSDNPTTQPAQTAPASTDQAETSEQNTEAVPPLPVLVGVSVRALHAPPPAGRRDDATAAINAPVRAAISGASPRDLLASWLTQTEPATFRDELDRRLMQIVAGEYEAARQPVESVSGDQQALTAGLVEALIAVREGHLGDPARAASSALEAIDGAADTLRAQGDLAIPTIAICREVVGYGQYTPIEPASFPAGAESEFVIYCEVRNFQSQKDTDGLFQTRFSMRTTLLNRAGDTVLEAADPAILDRCRNLRRDCFIPRLIRLPATLSPGEYVAKVTLVDKLGEKVAENRATFRVSALAP
jgi:hypothetical protein